MHRSVNAPHMAELDEGSTLCRLARREPSPGTCARDGTGSQRRQVVECNDSGPNGGGDESFCRIFRNAGTVDAGGLCICLPADASECGCSGNPCATGDYPVGNPVWGRSLPRARLKSRDAILQHQERLTALLRNVDRTTDLPERRQIDVFNTLEAISALINRDPEGRMVCWRERPVGSNRTQTACMTVAQMRAEREASQTEIARRDQR